MPDEHGNPTAPGECLLLAAGIPVERWPSPFDGNALLKKLDAIHLRYCLEAAAAKVPATGGERADAGRIIDLAKQLAEVISSASPIVHSVFRTSGEPALLSELLRLSRSIYVNRDTVREALGGLSRKPSAYTPAWLPEHGATPHRVLLTKTLPSLYRNLFGRDFTWSPSTPSQKERTGQVQHTEGVRFVAVTASHVLGVEVSEQAVVSAVRHDTKTVAR